MKNKHLNPRTPRYLGIAEDYVKNIINKFEDSASSFLFNDKFQEKILDSYIDNLSAMERKFYVYEDINYKENGKLVKTEKKLTDIIPLKVHDYMASRLLKITTANYILNRIMTMMQSTAYDEQVGIDYSKFEDESGNLNFLFLFKEKYRPKDIEFILLKICSILNLSYFNYLNILSEDIVKANSSYMRPNSLKKIERYGWLVISFYALANSVRNEFTMLTGDLDESTGIWHFLNLFDESDYFKKTNLDSKMPYELMLLHLSNLESIYRIETAFNRMIYLRRKFNEATDSAIKKLYYKDFENMFIVSSSFLKNNKILEKNNLEYTIDLSDKELEKPFRYLANYATNLIPESFKYENLSSDKTGIPPEYLTHEWAHTDWESKNLTNRDEKHSLNTFVEVETFFKNFKSDLYNSATVMSQFSISFLGDIQKLLPASALDWGETIMEFEPETEKVGKRITVSNYFIENLKVSYSAKEGKILGHCGNQPRARSGDILLSLRKKVVTRVRGKETVGYTAHSTITVDVNGVVREAKGQSNTAPREIYWSYLAKLYCDFDYIKLGTGGLGHWPSSSNYPDYDIKNSLDIIPKEVKVNKFYMFDFEPYFMKIGIFDYLTIKNTTVVSEILKTEVCIGVAEAVSSSFGLISKDLVEMNKIIKNFIGDVNESSFALPKLSSSTKTTYIKLFNYLESVGNDVKPRDIESLLDRPIESKIFEFLRNPELRLFLQEVVSKIVNHIEEEYEIDFTVSVREVVKSMRKRFSGVLDDLLESIKNLPKNSFSRHMIEREFGTVDLEPIVEEVFLLYLKDNKPDIYYGRIKYDSSLISAFDIFQKEGRSNQVSKFESLISFLKRYKNNEEISHDNVKEFVLEKFFDVSTYHYDLVTDIFNNVEDNPIYNFRKKLIATLIQSIPVESDDIGEYIDRGIADLGFSIESPDSSWFKDGLLHYFLKYRLLHYSLGKKLVDIYAFDHSVNQRRRSGWGVDSLFPDYIKIIENLKNKSDDSSDNVNSGIEESAYALNFSENQVQTLFKSKISDEYKKIIYSKISPSLTNFIIEKDLINNDDFWLLVKMVAGLSYQIFTYKHFNSFIEKQITEHIDFYLDGYTAMFEIKTIDLVDIIAELYNNDRIVDDWEIDKRNYYFRLARFHKASLVSEKIKSYSKDRLSNILESTNIFLRNVNLYFRSHTEDLDKEEKDYNLENCQKSVCDFVRFSVIAILNNDNNKQIAKDIFKSKNQSRTFNDCFKPNLNKDEVFNYEIFEKTVFEFFTNW